MEQKTQIRYSQPNLARPFRVPGGLVGVWLIAGIGFVAMVFGFVLSFYPPSQLPVGSPLFYTLLVAASTLVFSAIPLIIHGMRRPQWQKPAEKD